LSRSLRALDRATDPVEDRFRFVQDRFASGGEPRRSWVPLDQLHSEVALEIAYLPRERRLRDVESSSGAHEAALLGDRDEVSEVAQLHNGSGAAANVPTCAHGQRAAAGRARHGFRYIKVFAADIGLWLRIHVAGELPVPIRLRPNVRRSIGALR
jgi:hypothetical protein